MDYTRSVNFLSNLSKSGSKYGLDSIKMLLNTLGNPEKNLRVIHVAGTNGKGTVSNILSQILLEAGLSVGIYNSPHITTYNEVIRINGVSVSDVDFAKATSQVATACSIMVSNGYSHPTCFECLTAISLLIMYNAKVDIAIIEVGMGGRLDATNVFERPLVSVITSISMDHTDLLGSSLSEIAYEKAGIIKAEVPVVVAKNKAESIEVINTVAHSMNAPVYLTSDSNWTYEIVSSNLSGMVINIHSPGKDYNSLETRFIGLHQIDNIMLALNTIQILTKDSKYVVEDEHIYKGLLNTYWPCRLEYLLKPVPLILDVAHNAEGIQAFVDTVLSNHSGPLTVLFGVLKDKEVDAILKILSSIPGDFILTQPKSTRALEASLLADMAKPYFQPIAVIEDVIEAFEYAVKIAKKTNTLLCCVGSLYLSLPIRNYIL